MKIVEVENLSVKFGNFHAVKNISFSVNEGEIFGFLGANGAGKTTTIRILCGLLIPSLGNVFIDSIKSSTENESLIKQKIGYMSQKFTLYEDLSIEENLSFAAAIRQIPPNVYRLRKEELFQFIGLERNTDTIVGELPEGTKQEVALTVSMLHNPKIIFLDEPTAGVSPATRMRFWGLIKKLVAQQKTVFVSTHYMDEAENCSKIALMRAGELIALDTPINLKKSICEKNDPLPSLEDVFVKLVEGESR